MSRTFFMPKVILTGKNASEEAVPYLMKMGKKALIVTGKTVVTISAFKALTDKLSENGIEYSIFDGITGEPTDTMIEAGLAAYHENKCDFLIGIGGGSPMDSVKAIAALDACGGKISDYAGAEITGCIAPIAAFPTTAGTGSEATRFTVISDTKTQVKMLLSGAALIPDMAVVDPALTVTSPPKVTAATGLDALTHAVESYTSKKAQPLSDIFAISAVKRIVKYLPDAYKDGRDLKAREEMSLAALEAGIAINNASVTIVHGMSRPIGALFHVPHGMSNAMLLESCMSFAKEGAVERFADLGRAVGASDATESDYEAASAFVKLLGDICKICNIPTLSEYGIDRNVFFSFIDKMADDAIGSGSPSNTRRSVSADDIKRLYSGLWKD